MRFVKIVNVLKTLPCFVNRHLWTKFECLEPGYQMPHDYRTCRRCHYIQKKYGPIWVHILQTQQTPAIIDASIKARL